MHGPALDERLKDEVEPLERGAPVSARAEEFRDPEAAGERERETGARLTMDDAEVRSMIARWLNRVDYPAHRDVLVAEAESNNAPRDVIDVLRQLPDETTWTLVGGSPRC